MTELLPSRASRADVDDLDARLHQAYGARPRECAVEILDGELRLMKRPTPPDA